jgi:cysteine desulfurase
MALNLHTWFRKKRIHLDYASTTPVHPDVYKAMRPYWSEKWANPSAIYREGMDARNVIESCRAELGRLLHVRASDITFTSGGTESNNLAILGLTEALRKKGKAYSDMEIISTRIEHPSILGTIEHLETLGVVVKYVPVDREGKIILEKLNTLFTPHTIVCTFAYANSEIGVVQDVKKITRLIRAWNETHKGSIRTHLDASQAPLWLPCMLDQLGVDLMTLDAGKCYGPKGAGVLVKRHWVDLTSYVHGGKQEHGLRPGTESAALIVGCTKALVRAQSLYAQRSERIKKLRDRFIDLLTERISGTVLNGSRTMRIANNVNVSIPGIDTEYAVIALDAKGIAASTRSACGTGEGSGSHVVREVTHDEALALSTIRFTLGEETAEKDLTETVSALTEHLKLVRTVSR